MKLFRGSSFIWATAKSLKDGTIRDSGLNKVNRRHLLEDFIPLAAQQPPSPNLRRNRDNIEKNQSNFFKLLVFFSLLYLAMGKGRRDLGGKILSPPSTPRSAACSILDQFACREVKVVFNVLSSLTFRHALCDYVWGRGGGRFFWCTPPLHSFVIMSQVPYEKKLSLIIFKPPQIISSEFKKLFPFSIIIFSLKKKSWSCLINQRVPISPCNEIVRKKSYFTKKQGFCILYYTFKIIIKQCISLYTESFNNS